MALNVPKRTTPTPLQTITGQTRPTSTVTTSPTSTTSTTSSGSGTASGAHNTSLSSGIANHTTKTNGQANTAKTSGITASSPSGGGSLSGGSTSTITVQPTYISGGKGGNTYIVTSSDNTPQHSIAASGISMEGAAKDLLEKAARAEAKGDTATAEKYRKSAGEFYGAANYEAETKILDTYGTKTGQTYDATASIYLNESGTGVNVASTALTYKAGDGLLGSTQTESLGAKTVTTSLGITADELKNAGGNTEVKATGGGGVAPIAITGKLSNDSPLVEALGGRITESPVQHNSTPDLGGFMQTGSNLVDGFAHLPETLASDGSTGGFIAGLAATMVLPTDLVKVSKNFADGNGDKNTFWDYLYAAADVLSFIPIVGVGVKAVKVGLKSLKVGGQIGFNGLGVAGELTTGTDGDNDAPAKNTNLIGNTAPYAMPEIDWANTELKIGDVIKKNNSANTPTQHPTEQKTTPTLTPEETAEYDYSGLADLYSLVAQQGGGSGGGSGTTVITNEAQPVDYSGVFRYIIPVAAIIGVVIIIAAFAKGSKKRGGVSA